MVLCLGFVIFGWGCLFSVRVDVLLGVVGLIGYWLDLL